MADLMRVHFIQFIEVMPCLLAVSRSMKVNHRAEPGS
jgi:hypothetical protein